MTNVRQADIYCGLSGSPYLISAVDVTSLLPLHQWEEFCKYAICRKGNVKPCCHEGGYRKMLTNKLYNTFYVVDGSMSVCSNGAKCKSEAWVI